MDLTLVELRAEATHDLRRRVLRTGTPSTSVDFPGDDDPATIHLGLRDGDGHLVAVATMNSHAWAARPDVPGRHLRGMAVEPDVRNRGVGSRLLDAVVDRARADGATILWANARDAALSLYLRAGFDVVGHGFVTADTGLPHHVVVLEL